jgi:hypothetical protein
MVALPGCAVQRSEGQTQQSPDGGNWMNVAGPKLASFVDVRSSPGEFGLGLSVRCLRGDVTQPRVCTYGVLPGNADR